MAVVCVTYIEADGTEHQVQLNEGTSLMQGAINNKIPGIEGDCSGLCACSTCHIYIAPQWEALCGSPGELESEVLEFVVDRAANSRLSCQIVATADHDGMIVRLPRGQY